MGSLQYAAIDGKERKRLERRMTVVRLVSRRPGFSMGFDGSGSSVNDARVPKSADGEEYLHLYVELVLL
jgi:hypothetical protein